MQYPVCNCFAEVQIGHKTEMSQSVQYCVGCSPDLLIWGASKF